ncbi:MAG: AAA family ATPase [Deltaproteobacteria bacterium]|nr:AAA family ATPase [Deltaproteobacteria bacterium]
MYEATAFLSLNPERVIIDEAQQYPELFKVLRGTIDTRRQQKGRFLLTGSSSPDIVRGITESLAGRIATVELSPFTQNEFYESPPSRLSEMTTPYDENDLENDFKNLKDLKISC